MRSVACLISLHVSCGWNHGCLIAAVATAIVVLPRRILLRPQYALERFLQGFNPLLMLSLCVLACVVPAYVVPDLILRMAALFGCLLYMLQPESPVACAYLILLPPWRCAQGAWEVAGL